MSGFKDKQNICESNSTWLASFRETHGRPPRVLHIGNIANNAYINSKILRDAGVISDVICYDYYHIMGCPEWEDADFEGEVRDQFYPQWWGLDLKGFERPGWFVSGPFRMCVEYLCALRCGNIRKAAFWKKAILLRYYVANAPSMAGVKKFFIFCRSVASKGRKFLSRCRHRIKRYIGLLSPKKNSEARDPLFEKSPFDKRVDWLISRFSKSFPQREDGLTPEDFAHYPGAVISWGQLFAHYDIIHAYATDGILPLLCNKPYVAFEHGTIRDIPFQKTTQGRLCALTYAMADHVCITNADNIRSAKRLGLSRYSFIPHPVNEEFLEKDEESIRLYSELHERLNSDFIVFHPPRHHWEEERRPDWEKGNDIFIRGFARFVKEVNPKASAIFIEWGKTVDESKALIRELGIEDRVLWMAPLPNRKMIRYINATDMMADQFYLGAFGSTLPKAMACGKVSMIYLDTKLHEWCFPEMPPVINAGREQEVFSGLKKMYIDKEWAGELAEAARLWYMKYHSNEVILELLLGAYEKVLARR